MSEEKKQGGRRKKKTAVSFWLVVKASNTLGVEKIWTDIAAV